nr:MAG TPA: hypothetical protein [Caudoviricetes sp.]DAY35978.1 MAG TPA: hypothetical protein [Caudoviricetes sp.]
MIKSRFSYIFIVIFLKIYKLILYNLNEKR